MSTSLKTQDKVAIAAYQLGTSKYPAAPQDHHFAFANAVSYGVTGEIGSYPGDTMRQALAITMLNTAKFEQGCELSAVAAFVEVFCYGEITIPHATIGLTHNFQGDSEEDRAAARLLLAAQPV